MIMNLGNKQTRNKVVARLEQIQFFALRKHASAWRVALASLLLIVVFGLELGGQQKSGLSGTGPVVQGTPDDPLRDRGRRTSATSNNLLLADRTRKRTSVMTANG